MNETCRATKADGDPCSIDFGLSDDGLCFHHDPERADEAARARKRGGQAMARRMATTGLDPEELPPLTSHAAAETWTDRIGRAAAVGRIGANAANAALRAVREWREARDAGKVSERLDKLTDALAEWRKTGDAGPVLKLVEGNAS